MSRPLVSHLALLVGLLLLPQLAAQADSPRNPTSDSGFERTAKGAIAIWNDEIPGAAVATDASHLASRLREAGYGVSLITTDELADRAILTAAHFDLLILPYGEVYPATGADALRQFLRRG
ncbi:MAG: hypothetical protein HQ582_21090, partial [Planctomycetes bacterium]|nr:hypothetical protein [Planctomycetota bacterium]